MASQEDLAQSKRIGRTITTLARRTAIFGVVAGLLAAIYTLTQENEYRAQCGLLLAPLPFTEAIAESGEKSPENPAAQISYLMGRPLPIPGYDLLLRNDSIVEQLRDKLQAMKAQEGTSEEIPLETVRESMELRTRILKQTVYDVEYLPVVELAYLASDPQIAANMANEWSRLAIDLSEEVSAKGKTGSVQFLQTRFESTVKQLDTVEKAIQAHETQWDLENMARALVEVQTLATQYELDQTRLTTDIESKQAELKDVVEDLGTLTEKTTLRKAMPDEAYWLMIASGKGKPDDSMVLETEVVNDLYANLREKRNTLQTTISGMVEKKNATMTALSGLREQVSQLQTDLAEQKRVRAELTRQSDVFREQYKRVAENLEAARIAEAETEPDLKVAYAAVPPDEKVGPIRSLTVLVAAFLGAMVVPVHFFGVIALRRFGKYLDTGLGGDTGIESS